MTEYTMPKSRRGRKPIDLGGQSFGRLRALRPVGQDKSKRILWECRCECGNLTTLSSRNLISGNTKSCGCLKNEVSIYFREIVLKYDGDDCLVWPYSRDSTGYGRVQYKGKWAGVHRAVCIECHGEPPTEHHEAAHSCGFGSKGCCSPKHLSWKTQRENVDDNIRHSTFKVRSDNKSGHTGVSYQTSNRRWRAEIGTEYIGVFLRLEDAIAARAKVMMERGLLDGVAPEEEASQSV